MIFFVIVFLVDILVYSKSEDENMDRLKVVLQVLKEYLLFDKYNKYELLLSVVDFLGHIVSGEGIEVGPKKTKAVKNWPRSFDPNLHSNVLGFSRVLLEIFLMGLYKLILL